MSIDSTASSSTPASIFKILLLGDSNVVSVLVRCFHFKMLNFELFPLQGKTCIVQRFCDDSFIEGYISTIGNSQID